MCVCVSFSLSNQVSYHARTARVVSNPNFQGTFFVSCAEETRNKMYTKAAGESDASGVRSLTVKYLSLGQILILDVFATKQLNYSAEFENEVVYSMCPGPSIHDC